MGAEPPSYPNLQRWPAEHRAVLAAPRSKAPPRHASRRRCFPPRRACGPASDVLCRDHPARPTFRSNRAGTRQTSAPPWPRQRPCRRDGQDAFRRRVPSPPHRLVPDAGSLPCGSCHTPIDSGRRLSPPLLRPLSATAVSSSRVPRTKPWDPRRSATVRATSPPRAGFERRFRPPGDPGGLDHPRSAKGELPARRFPSTSAIRTAREHNHGPLDLRPTASIRRIQLALDWERAPDGVGAPSAKPTAASR